MEHMMMTQEEVVIPSKLMEKEQTQYHLGFMKYYLNPKGTPIYGGETAVGTYYEGATLLAVNKRYANR